MAEKFDPNNLSPKDLAKHLRKPSGADGKEVGKQMNKGNKYICLNSYKLLKPTDNQSVLEIGMGNGFFVKDLLKMANNINYTGVDFSKLMVEEATKINCNLKNVNFIEASIEKLPFSENHFDIITTTNTIYFWPNPKENITELLRVLKPNGKLLIGYRSKEFMDKVQFTNFGFSKFKNNDVELLLKDNGYNKITTAKIMEPEIEFENTKFAMEGFYTVGYKK